MKFVLEVTVETFEPFSFDPKHVREDVEQILKEELDGDFWETVKVELKK